MKFLFYFSISSTVWILLSSTRGTSVLACVFNKDTSHALCPACADGWRRGPCVVPSVLQGNESEPR